MKNLNENLTNRSAEEAKESLKPTKEIYFAGGCFW